jgi:hypothetical protein
MTRRELNSGQTTDCFDAEVGGIAIQFTPHPVPEVTEVKVSGTCVRNLRHRRVALPKT